MNKKRREGQERREKRMKGKKEGQMEEEPAKQVIIYEANE